eukprot:2558650-Rhodomonas_salina.2
MCSRAYGSLVPPRSFASKSLARSTVTLISAGGSSSASGPPSAAFFPLTPPAWPDAFRCQQIRHRTADDECERVACPTPHSKQQRIADSRQQGCDLRCPPRTSSAPPRCSTTAG